MKKQHRMNKQHLGLILMVTAAVTLASATILIKMLTQQTSIPPQHLAIWRFSIAAPVLWGVGVFNRPKTAIPRVSIWRLLGLGCVFAVASFSAIFAINRLPSSLYVIIVYVYPSLVVLLDLLIGKPVPKLIWLGLPLTFVGLILVAFDFGSTLAVDRVGFLITLINAVVMAIYMVLSEKILSGVSEKFRGSNWMMTGAMLAGLATIPLLGISTPDSTRGWLLLLAFGILGTAVPISTMNLGVELLGSSRGSVIMMLQPVVAVLLSTLLLDESLNAQQWIGGLIVILAVALLQLSKDNAARNGENGVHG